MKWKKKYSLSEACIRKADKDITVGKSYKTFLLMNLDTAIPNKLLAN